MVAGLSLVATVGGADAQQSPAGSIRGVVYDRDFETPLGQVRVSFVEIPLATMTRDDGTFLFEAVPPGSHTLTFSKDGYQRRHMSGIVVLAGRMAEVRVDLVSEVIDMEELVITGQDLLGDSELGILEVRAASVNVQDAISSEIMSKAGASDVAGALKLVVGASVSEGKYATVRGLSDRYTGTTLNGVRIPSADPRRRAVQVDLFPTGTIENVSVSKTFTPDLQGDFTGGGVDIRTRSVPDERVLSGSFSVEHNTEATNNPRFLTYRGGGVEFLGLAGGDRDLPRETGQTLPPFPAPTYNPTPAQSEAAEAWDRMVRSFAPVMGTGRRRPGPNFGFSLVAGDRLGLDGEGALGILGALTYSHKHDSYEGGQNNTFQISEPDQPLVLGAPRIDSRGIDEVLIGALGSFVLRPSERHELGLRLVANQSAEDEARFQVTGSNSVEQNQGLHYTERTVGSAQLYGDHSRPGAASRVVRLDWFAAFNLTRQDEPDVRFFRDIFNFGTLTGDQPANSTDADNTRRIFRDIGERGTQGALNLTLPFTQWGGIEGRIKTGIFRDATDRDYRQRSFYYIFPSQPGGNPASTENSTLGYFEAAYPGQLWTDVFLDPERIGLAGNRCPPGAPITNPRTVNCAARDQLLWVLDPNNESDVDYAGTQEIGALYAMAEVPLHPKLRLIGGARHESTRLSVVPANQFGVVEVIEVQPGGDRGVIQVPESLATASIDEAAILPSLSLVSALTSRMNLRASWSRTIARPTFRELAPVATEEFLAGDEFVGNTGLRLSGITNHDLRWEWFRRPGEVLAVSLFRKDLRDPIELVSFFAGGRTFVQPVNYERGEVRGAELEVRAPLGEIATALKGLVMGANLTIIDSQVDVPAFERESLATFGLDEATRRLQGQPERILNASLTWESERLGASFGAFYNVVGETLLTGAARGSDGGVPNVFEKPFRTLDLTYSQDLTRGNRKLSIAFKARNLLRPERTSVFQSPDGQEVVKSLRDTAATYSLSASLKW
jgi:hypothetical protein